MAHNCENCKFRAHYDQKPNSLLGKFWRWHINFCPGWKGYFTSQSDEKKAELRGNYSVPVHCCLGGSKINSPKQYVFR